MLNELTKYPLYFNNIKQTYPHIKPGTFFLSRTVTAGNIVFTSGFDGRTLETTDRRAPGEGLAVGVWDAAFWRASPRPSDVPFLARLRACRWERRARTPDRGRLASYEPMAGRSRQDTEAV